MEKTKILIVDDHAENITALSELIANDDIVIYSALNAEGALNHLIEHQFALALLDVQMPGVSGFELARLIRGVNRSRHLPVIFVTAQQPDQSIIFEGYGSGAVDLLFKPLDPHIVRSKVRSFVILNQQNEMLLAQMEEVKSLRRKADEANLAKSQFLANMSHEIRTPLASVLGFADVLSQKSLSESEQDECLSAIRRNGELLLRLIDDILDLSKIEAQHLQLVKVEFSLLELLKDVESSLGLRAAKKGVVLEFVMPSDFGTELRYLSDPIRIKQILLNVIGNAIKFTESGFVKVALEMEASATDGLLANDHRLIFKITDTGVGMKADEVKKIFQPFSQADVSNRRRFGGTGLGLVISRQLAQSLGGDLSLIHSEFGKGSVFEISLLAEKIAAAPAIESVKKIQSKSSADLLRGLRLLVVDDVSDNRLLVERYMKDSGAIVLQAAGGKEAVEMVLTGQPDLILMDIQMPIMDGYEATEKIRAMGYSNPIIALTAHAMQEEIKKCLESGCNEVLTKPARRKDLLERISQAIGDFRKMTEPATTSEKERLSEATL